MPCDSGVLIWCPVAVPASILGFQAHVMLKIASQFPCLRSFLTLDKPMGQMDMNFMASCLSALIEYSVYRASCQAS